MRLGSRPNEAERPADDAHLVMGAVRDDVRQTLRVAWMDPGLEAATASPVFFTAAWSSVRPNVGRTFLRSAKALRDSAAGSVRTWGEPADLSERLEVELSDGELGRIADTARAVHLASAKVQIVLHAMHRAIRRERLGGTGMEEAPVRRGVPDWQRWMSVVPTPDPARPILWQAKDRFGTPSAPPSLRLFARWPSAVDALWSELEPHVGTPAWTAGTARLRRILLEAVDMLPHPVELQWPALRQRGFDEEARLRMLDTLEAHDATAAGQTLAAAFAWVSLGEPELGSDG